VSLSRLRGKRWGTVERAPVLSHGLCEPFSSAHTSREARGVGASLLVTAPVGARDTGLCLSSPSPPRGASDA